MRIKHSKVLTILLAFTMLLVVFSPAVFADSLPGLKLPVTVKLSGTPPTDDEDYHIILKADNPDYPMPEGSVDGSYDMTITGEGTVELPQIEFSSLGVYTYTMEQKPASNKLATYDDSKYNLVVFVTNAEDGSGLEITVNLYLLGVKEKQADVVFHNEYEEEATTPPVDKPKPEKPKPEKPQPPKPEKPQPPKTSDNTSIGPYIGLFISGAAMIFMLGMTKKGKKIEE